jgi:hypothetical protein
MDTYIYYNQNKYKEIMIILFVSLQQVFLFFAAHNKIPGSIYFIRDSNTSVNG